MGPQGMGPPGIGTARPGTDAGPGPTAGHGSRWRRAARCGTPDIDDGPPSGAKPKRSGAAGKGLPRTCPKSPPMKSGVQITSYHGHKLMVTAPNRFFKARISAELSPDAEIAVDISDLSAVRPGDKVSARGYYITPGVCPRTDSLVVTLTNPLGARGGRAHRPPVAGKNGDAAAHHPAEKAKPAPAAAPQDQNPFPDDEKRAKPAAGPPADKPPPAADFPKEKDENPAMEDPDAKPKPARNQSPTKRNRTKPSPT